MKNIFSFVKKTKHFFIGLLIGASVISSFAFVDDYFEVSKNLDIFATLYRELNVYYVDETKPGDLMKKGIDSMLESLDPYTNYIPESDIEDYRYMTTGQYGGIGSLIRQKDEYVVVSEPYEGYPAQKADLRAGDIILEVNGVSVKGKKTDEISKLLKGQPGTSAKLLIKREGEAATIEKTIVREDIKVKNVSYYGMINENSGLIKLTGFTENAAGEVKSAFLELKKNPNFKYLILDLRGNPGGLLKEAVDIVNLFVEKGTDIVNTKGKIKEWDKSHKATNNPIDTEIPIAVLVDRGSASAAEIVSGAIQDLDRGVIIGQRTYGKGLVQQTRPLSYNAQLKVTVAKYYIPSGRCIQALDYAHRNEDGGVDKIADSLITAFKTKNNRIVYDGGGVKPDISMDDKKYSNISATLSSKGLIFDFATQYRIKNPTIKSPKEFTLSDSEYELFVKSLEGKDYEYTTLSESALKEFKEDAEKEKYYESIKLEYEALKNKIASNKKEDLKTYKQEIKELLESEIASRYYYQTGRLESSLKYDVEAKEAIALLNDKAKYSGILTTIEKADKPFNQQVLNKTPKDK
ncbi:MAG: S41 family peptidase [Bacteroidetes bacterium]|nr:S41 family peptidase [Bacteroidota bacterium]